MTPFFQGPMRPLTRWGSVLSGFAAWLLFVALVNPERDWLREPTGMARLAAVPLELTKFSLDQEGQPHRHHQRLEPDPQSSVTLDLYPGEMAALLRMEILCSALDLPGVRGHFETAATVPVSITYGSYAEGPPRLLDQGLRVETYARETFPVDELTTHLLRVLVKRPVWEDLQTTVTVAVDVQGWRMKGAGVWPLDSAGGMVLPALLVLPWAGLFLFQVFRGSDEKSCNRGSLLPWLPALLMVSLALVQNGIFAPPPPTAWPLAAWGFLVLCGVLALLWPGLSRQSTFHKWPSYLLLPTMGVMLLPAALTRWDWLLRFQQGLLQPDAVGYMEIAQWMTRIDDGLYREPFFPLLLRLGFETTAFGPLQGRLMTYGLSLLLGAVMILALRRFASLAITALTLLAYATHELMAHSAVLVLREELVPLLVLGLALLLPARRFHTQQIGRWVIAGICGGFLLNTRINTLTLILPLGILAWWFAARPRSFHPPAIRRTARAILGLILYGCFAIAMVLPNMAVMKARYGDAMHASNKHAAWYRNAEFAGQPGHVTREEFQRHAYAGLPTTWGEYLFGLHTISDVTSATVSGLLSFAGGTASRDTLFRFSLRRDLETEYLTLPKPTTAPAPWDAMIHLLALVGTVRALLGFSPPLMRFCGWAFLLFLLPLAPLEGWGLLPHRLLFTMAPLTLLLAAEALQSLSRNLSACGTWLCRTTIPKAKTSR